jgi:hypothetical protein
MNPRIRLASALAADPVEKLSQRSISRGKSGAWIILMMELKDKVRVALFCLSTMMFRK